ncbi:MFS transporter [Planococcus rifietoensis]|uniref:MFS transporter n=1 Tax=Planococcus rifietoensis TaxID=200991 RepID=UPI00384BECDC
MFKSKHVRNLFVGRLISTSGDSLYQVAVIWYVFELTHDAFYTGLATAAVMFPKSLNFLFGPLIEKLHKGKVLLYSQFLQFLLMLAIPIGIYFKYESISLILSIMFLISMLENFQGTAEVAIVPKIISKDKRGHFNSYIGSAQQMVDIMMKAVFASSILWIGIETIYLFNAFTYLMAAVFFSSLKGLHTKVKPEENSQRWPVYKETLKEGFIYFFTTKVFILCLPFLIANFAFGMTEALLPVYANERGGSGLYGVLIIAMTVGNLTGSLLVLKVMKYPLGLLMIVLPFLSFGFWVASIAVPSNIFSTLLLSMAFIPFGMMSILLITFLQTAVDENLLARVSSIIDSVLVSAMPLGAITGGVLTPLLGVKTMMFISSSGLLIIALYFILNKKVRRLPELKNISMQE